MLRKDTIYITKNHWEPKIPSTETIKVQVDRDSVKLAGSIRLSMGKVIGVDGKREPKIPSAETVKVQVGRNSMKSGVGIRHSMEKVIGVDEKTVRFGIRKIR